MSVSGWSASGWSGSVLAWHRELDALKVRLWPVFGRRELRASSGAFLDGLLSGVERKTGWLMAEQAGLERPYRMQSLLGRSQWDADTLRDVVRVYAIEALGDADGVLVVDETGFLKKGTHSHGEFDVKFSYNISAFSKVSVPRSKPAHTTQLGCRALSNSHTVGADSVRTKMPLSAGGLRKTKRKRPANEFSSEAGA